MDVIYHTIYHLLVFSIFICIYYTATVLNTVSNKRSGRLFKILGFRGVYSRGRLLHSFYIGRGVYSRETFKKGGRLFEVIRYLDTAVLIRHNKVMT